MKKIEQPWEKRNLGVKSVEYCFDVKDTIKDIPQDLLSQNDYDYVQCRVPAGKMDLVYKLQEKAFRFAETSIDLSANLRQLQLPDIYLPFEKELEYVKVEELESVYGQICKGIFDTDRIYLDPFFRREQSGIRYANWCRQEVETGSTQVYVVKREEETMGFFALKEKSKNVSDSLLAGLYDKNNTMGWGFSVLYYPMLQAQREGKKRIETSVSSNNPDSLRMHLRLGYVIKNMKYVLIKHIVH